MVRALINSTMPQSAITYDHTVTCAARVIDSFVQRYEEILGLVNSLLPQPIAEEAAPEIEW